MFFLSLSFPLFVAASALCCSSGDQKCWNARAEALIRVFPALQEKGRSGSLTGKTFSWSFNPKLQMGCEHLDEFQEPSQRWILKGAQCLCPAKLWVWALFQESQSHDGFTGLQKQDPHSLSWILALSCYATPWYCCSCILYSKHEVPPFLLQLQYCVGILPHQLRCYIHELTV